MMIPQVEDAMCDLRDILAEMRGVLLLALLWREQLAREAAMGEDDDDQTDVTTNSGA